MTLANRSKQISLRALAFAAALLSSVAARAQDSGPIDPARLSRIVKVLASDEFMGRAPGGPGEKPTLEYLIRQLQVEARLGVQGRARQVRSRPSENSAPQGPRRTVSPRPVSISLARC